jgi:hypothetical protein
VALRTVAVTGEATVPSAKAGGAFVTEVEIVNPGGGVVRVRQTGPEGMDVAGLAAAFMGKG